MRKWTRSPENSFMSLQNVNLPVGRRTNQELSDSRPDSDAAQIPWNGNMICISEFDHIHVWMCKLIVSYFFLLKNRKGKLLSIIYHLFCLVYVVIQETGTWMRKVHLTLVILKPKMSVPSSFSKKRESVSIFYFCIESQVYFHGGKCSLLRVILLVYN